MKLTGAQARAAAAAGSVAVVAGAGSGKTHMLVARYLYLLGNRSPLEVVAVTFTEKAAAELRARIRAAVAREDPGNLERLAELDAAPISTIHALCARIIAEHPQSAGAAPGAQVQDAPASALWRTAHLPSALGALPLRLFAQLPYSGMAQALVVLLNDPLLSERALEVGTDGWDAWVQEAREEARRELVESAAWNGALTALKGVQGPPGDRIELARQEALRAAADLERGPDPSAAVAAIQALKLSGGSARAWPDGAFTGTKAAISALREVVSAEAKRGLLTLELGEADDWLRAALPDLREAHAVVQGTLADLKREQGLLDFADLEVLALRALQDEAVRSYYSQRWTAYLLDEAQDTNPVQAQILSLLTAGASRTVVGDEKQSIYRFRRADVTHFRELRGAVVQEGGEEVSLDLSFRTHAGLVDLTNRVFAPLLGELHAPLIAGRPALDGAGVTYLKVDPEAGGARATKQAAEADAVAAHLRSLLDSGAPVHDPETGLTRPIRPGDMAVLTRSWAALRRFGAALARHGVAARDAGPSSLLETREAQDVVALLTAVSSGDPLALVTVLRSPFCGVPDTALLALSRERGERTWMDALLTSDDPRLQLARRHLSELRQSARQLPPSRLLALADRLSGYSAHLANFWDADRRLADWRGVQALLRDLERGNDEVFTVARRLSELQRAEVMVPRPPLAAGDAVTLTTMHGSKGLEWPLVVVGDLSWTPPAGSDPLLVDAVYGVALKPPREELPALHTVIHERQRKQDALEARRLLYVALTRARDHLLLSASGDAPRHSLLELLEPGLMSAGIAVQTVPLPEGESGPLPLPPLPVPPLPGELWVEPVTLPGRHGPALVDGLGVTGSFAEPEELGPDDWASSNWTPEDWDDAREQLDSI